MVDLSKYEKVYEWDQVYGLMMGRRVITSTLVYLMKIGNEHYIDVSFRFTALIRKHIRDLDHGVHPNAKMQEAYNRYKVCEVYILAQVGVFEHPAKIKQQFVDRFSPSLNVDEFELKYSKDFWCKDEDDSVEVKIKMPYKYIKRLKDATKGQGILLEKYIQASAIAVFDTYRYSDSNKLTKEGITILDNSLYGPYI